MKIVIVGGVAGGATAAARIRRLDEKAEIVIFERSGFISYANCGLPYYIGGVITDESALTLQSPEGFFTRFRIKAKVHHEVLSVNPEKKTVSVKNRGDGSVFEESYDKLLLAPGAKPFVPDIPGVDSEKIFTLRSMEDAFRIKEFTEKSKPKTAAIIGGGFVGIEMAENLSEAGTKVVIIEQAKQLLSNFDSDMASFIHSEIRRNGVTLALGKTVTGFSEKNGGIDVLFGEGLPIHADMVILAIGVRPENTLAKSAGIRLGIKGSIEVNEKMETSVKDIYAVGDAVRIKNYVSNNYMVNALAGPANKQARIAADNICGKNSSYKGSVGSSVIKVFSLTAASTGLSESTAKRAGFFTDKVILSPMSHAGYYPGGKVMTMKVVFEKETFRILGAQIAGYDGVDKRIDVIAAAIHAGMRADELSELDLAYAPPYSSAKDPVNMAGFMAENVKEGILKQWFIEDAERLLKMSRVTLLDTRTEWEFNRGHIEGFMNIPVDELRERIDEIPKGDPVYVICQSGLRSYIACRILKGYGFNAYNFAGGFRFYDAVMNDRRLAEESFPCGMDR
ncbi:MAG: FAD-dependent oxidoreductase [Oscillospiraceae bacterium]|nr:FAD-dependent oxidoreductase [Oscillospiraceae bacterium]